MKIDYDNLLASVNKDGFLIVGVEDNKVYPLIVKRESLEKIETLIKLLLANEEIGLARGNLIGNLKEAMEE